MMRSNYPKSLPPKGKEPMSDKFTYHPMKGWRRVWRNHLNGLQTGSEWKYKGFCIIRP